MGAAGRQPHGRRGLTALDADPRRDAGKRKAAYDCPTALRVYSGFRLTVGQSCNGNCCPWAYLAFTPTSPGGRGRVVRKD
jgi:hypothetical protein